MTSSLLFTKEPREVAEFVVTCIHFREKLLVKRKNLGVPHVNKVVLRQ